jgi:uncharacterized membrane protein YoaK (UPF0700 family)
MSGDRNARHGVPLIVLAAALAFASGATDLASLTRLGGVFASVMTGNLILVGLAAAHASGTLAAHTAIAFAGYIAGAGLGSRIAAGTRSEDVVWPPTVTVILLIEIVAFAGFAAGWELASSYPAGAWQLCLLAVAALSMGLQSAAMRSVGTPLSTTYLTGALTGAVAEVVTGGWRGKDVGLSAAVLASAAGGAAAGGGVLIAAPAALPVLPIGAIAIVIALATYSGTRL